MKSSANGMSRVQRSKAFQGEGTNWVLIVGSALLSTLSIHLGYKIKQVLDAKEQNNGDNNALKGNGKPTDRKKSSNYHLQSGFNCSDQEDESCCSCLSGTGAMVKQEVIQKLRQQLKRRDETMVEMQEQIVELQGSLNAHLLHSSHLQSLLDVANRELFESERETQRLRKAFKEGENGFAYGHFQEQEREEEKRIEMLKYEVDGLKDAIEGKEYLIWNYKDQRSELSMKIKELHERLDSQLPNIL